MPAEMSDADRKTFYEMAKAQAEDDYMHNNRDSQALTRWGGALLELANFMPGEEASSMVDEAVDKFQEALVIDPKKHEALWCLGNAYTSQGFLSPSKPLATGLFTKAKKCFKDAVQEQPENPIYKKGLDMTSKAPDLYDEIQKQINPPMRMPESSSFWFDVLGYATIIGTVLVVSAVVGMMNPQGPAAAGKPATK